MKKSKRIAAMIGVILLISMYILTLVSAIIATKYAHSLFLASIFCTFAIPVTLYAYMLIYKLVHKKNDIKNLPPEE